MKNHTKSFVQALACFAVILLHGPVSAVAGTIRADVSDSLYTSLAAQPEFASVGRIETSLAYGSGTLVGSFWVLTAAHMITDPNPSSAVFTIGGVDYTVGEWIPNQDYVPLSDTNAPESDIGIMRLDVAVSGVAAATRFTGISELGSTATIVGYGRTGTGLTGDTLPSGTKRAGNNVLDVSGANAGYPGWTIPDDYVLSDFDSPTDPAKNSYGSSTPLGLEYSSAPGDSGGGVFINVGGQMQLAGVVSFGTNGPVSNPVGYADASYGDLMGFTRVNKFNAWIDDQMSAIYWGNASGGSFGTVANWQDGATPGAANVAVFNLAGNHTVSFGADTENKRLRVRVGDVALGLDSYTYTLSDSSQGPSLLVGGQTAADSAKLTVSSGGSHFAISGSAQVGDYGAGSLKVDGGAAVSIGGNLTINSQGVVDIASGSVATGGLNLLGGTVTGAGSLTASGASTWSSGTMSGNGTTRIPAGGTLAINNPDSYGSTYLSGRTLENAGTVAKMDYSSTWATGTGTTINNLAGGVFDFQNDGYLIANSGSGATFNNAGTVRKSAGTGTSTIYWPFNNTGSVEVQTGTLSLSGGGSDTGSFSVSSNTTLSFNGGTYNLNAGASIANSGGVAFGGATVNVNTPLTLNSATTLSGGIFGGSGNVTFSNLTWTAGTMSGNGTTSIPAGGTLAIGSYAVTLDGRTLGNAGTVSWTGGSYGFLHASGSAATINNLTGSLFQIQSNNLHMDSYGGSGHVFNNTGALNVGAGFNSSIGWMFNNTGSVVLGSGSTLSLSGGGSDTGSFSVSSNATLSFGGGTHNLTGAAAITGSGNVKVSGGVLSVEPFRLANTGSLSVSGGVLSITGDMVRSPVSLTGGTLAVAGNLTVSQMTWNDGTMSGNGTTSIPAGGTLAIGSYAVTLDGRTLENAGTVSWTGGSYGFLHASGTAATINNLAGGLFQIQSNNLFMDSNGGSGHAFNNTGALNVGAGFNSSIGWMFNNTGRVVLGSGSTLSLNGGGSDTGSFSVSSNATLGFGGGTHNLTGEAAITGSGNVSVSGGVLNLNAPMLANTGALGVSSGTLSITGDMVRSPVSCNGGTLAVAGNLTVSQMIWSSGTMSGNGTTRIPAGGTLTISGSNKYLQGRTLENEGTMVQADNYGISATGTGATINNLAGGMFDFQNNGSLGFYSGSGHAFNNAGTVRKSAGTGTSSINWPFNNTGSVEVQAGTLWLSGGGADTGSFSVSSNATLNFGGGTHNLTGAAAITGSGNVSVSGGVLNLNAPMLANTGSLDVSGGTLSITGDITRNQITWSSGTMSGNGTTRIPAGGTMAISGSYYRYLQGRALENAGTMVQADSYGIAATGTGSMINNLAGGVFDFQPV